MNAELPANQRFAEATHQTISWFWKRLNSQELELSPPFQRNPVWQVAQKSFLIDTILRGYPIPELYLQSSTTAEGDEVHTVVDGQQRVRACMEFLDGSYALTDEAKEYSGLRFADLGDNLKKRIWQYRFVVRSLPIMEEEEIRNIFGRLNRNNVALNGQELRQATYWGEFITCVNKLSQDDFWVSSNIFTANDFRRMLDIEYVGELVVASLFGPQNKKATLDRFYGAFEEDFPDRERVESVFAKVLSEVAEILEWPNKLRWSKKIDFYALFLALSSKVSSFPLGAAERADLREKLVDFSESVNTVVRLPAGVAADPSISLAARVYESGIRNSSDLASRRKRINALNSVLWGPEMTEEPQHESTSPVDRLATIEDLYASAPDRDEENLDGGD
ncbi:DUF262 domain-containing protein [Streptomyces parvulus]|uniref:DUF262 domain-containing protein n=1 Tax=Streptomyces parvulus TaxID=146923 RepID=UPI000AF75A6D|nr:DUF262 domain-containing protein [Streptomyces parvulus]GGR56036.1 hypothetical protein GCM10010220_02430 [Streptomyces parvulus]